MADEKPVVDPILDMLSIDDEQARQREPAAGDLDIDPPADKPAVERDESGKFKGKDGKEEKAADPKPEVKPEAAKEADKPKETVPLATFLEKTNSLKEKLDAKDITIKQFEARMAALEAKLAPPKPADPEPDFIEDPKGYVDHKTKQALDAIAKANETSAAEGKKAQEAASHATEQVQLQRMSQDLQAAEQRFVQQNPDYYDALAHIRQVRAAQLREFNPEITEQAIVETIRGEEMGMSVQLMRQGRDPTQTAYNLAKHYGYQPKAAAAPAAAQIAKLPDPVDKRLPPDQTLGGGSSVNDAPYKDGEIDPVDLALASLLRKRA